MSGRREIYINPLLLVTDKKVRITEDFDSDSENATYLDIIAGKGFSAEKVTLDNYRDQDITFDLCLNMKRITAFYRQSGMTGSISFDEFKFAFLTKELSLVRYGAIEYMHLVPVGKPYATNQIWEYVFSLLELRRCRYRLAFDMPAFSVYLGLYGKCIRKWVRLETVREDMARFSHILAEFERVRDMLEDIYALATFERAHRQSPVVEYALPYLLAAERGDVFDSAEAAKTIYNYLILPDELHKYFRFRFFDMVLETDEIIEETVVEERPAIQEDEAAGFYRNVLVNRMEEIIRIRNVFKRIITMTEQVEAYDGDVDLRKQQQLYLDSLAGVEGRTHLQRRFRNTTMDVVLLRDVSFSTNLIRFEYAEAIVSILAALDGFAAVRTAVVDFSDYAVLRKTFEQTARECLVAPEAFGATLMEGALDMAADFTYRAAKRLVIVMTDGEIEDCEICAGKMLEMRSAQRLKFVALHITPTVYGDAIEVSGSEATCSYGLLDKALLQVLTRELS